MTDLGLDVKEASALRPRGAEAWVHPMAQVDADVVLGSGTRVWQFASAIRGTRTGADCSLASASMVDGSVLGDRCIVSHGAFIDPGAQLGNDVFIGPHVSMCNDYWPRVSKDGWFRTEDLISGKYVVTIILDGASIGASAVLLPGVLIGKGAMVAAGAVVTRHVPASHLYRRDGSVEEIDPKRIPNRMRVLVA